LTALIEGMCSIGVQLLVES